METLSQFLARQLLTDTRKHFSTLHQQWLDKQQEQQMPQNHMQHPKTDAQVADQKHAEHTALLNRVAELEQRVAALEASNMATPTASPSNAAPLKNNAVGTPADGQKPVSATPAPAAWASVHRLAPSS